MLREKIGEETKQTIIETAQDKIVTQTRHTNRRRLTGLNSKDAVHHRRAKAFTDDNVTDQSNALVIGTQVWGT